MSNLIISPLRTWYVIRPCENNSNNVLFQIDFAALSWREGGRKGVLGSSASLCLCILYQNQSPPNLGKRAPISLHSPFAGNHPDPPAYNAYI